ncbi:MAG: pentapeptide repeat-containing protein [Actinomycetota bacterium]|nr:pentapeptide repeat-containing protein [Actinomycetota bacterium]
MGAGPGRFAGKVAFGSTTGGRYVTAWSPRAQAEQFPAMAATAVGDVERCILYAQGDGTFRIQLGNRLWIGFKESLGWLLLTADPAQAVPVLLGGNPLGQRLQVKTPDGPATVVYEVGGQSPILTVNSSNQTLDAFAPVQVTPSLDAILQAKGCPGGDLSDVYLAGDLAGIDLSKAVLTRARLDGVAFGAGAKLTGAKLQGATLTGVTCNGAVLDEADLTGATLDGVAWGVPASASGIVLTGCSARGAALGGEHKPGLNCAGANLGVGDFTGADLRNLVLTRALAGGAILSGARLDGAQLDGATLTGAVAIGTSLRGAQMPGIRAQGACLARADLSQADLTRAQLGANSFLFSLAGTLAAGLDGHLYPQKDLLDAFAVKGITLSPEAPVTAIQKGRRWEVADPAGVYVLTVNAAQSIDVLLAGQAPATLIGATCQGTKAPGAGLAGADLRGVQWYASPATLDHADLGGAVLAGSLLTGTDFTQAYLSGADLSNCVLIQARFARCVAGRGASGQALSLEGSLLQGADFSDCTLQGALLVNAEVGLAEGTPLFTLPPSDQQYLTPQGLATLAPKFATAGHPLGKSPAVTSVKTWLLDNSADEDGLAPRLYRVQPATNALRVFDAKTSQYLFQLPSANTRHLSGTTAPAALVTAFNQASQGAYTLAAAAPITALGYWELRVSSDAPQVKAASYPTMRVYAGPARLRVYGCVLALLRDWPQYPSGLAFGATLALDGALDSACVGPSAHPRALVQRGVVDWTTFVTPDVEP